MTAPEIITRLIAATEDMIERLEECIADGNGELEDDRPAIAEAREAIAQAQAAIHPVEKPESKPADMRLLFEKIVEADGDYVGDLAEDNWLASVEFSPLLVARMLEVAYLNGRHDAEQARCVHQAKQCDEAVGDLFRRIVLYAPKPTQE